MIVNKKCRVFLDALTVLSIFDVRRHILHLNHGIPVVCLNLCGAHEANSVVENLKLHKPSVFRKKYSHNFGEMTLSWSKLPMDYLSRFTAGPAGRVFMK